MKAALLACWNWVRQNYVPRKRIVELLPLSVEDARSRLRSKLNYDFGADIFHASKGHIECVIGRDDSVRIIQVDFRGRSTTTIEAAGSLAATSTGSILDLEYRFRKAEVVLTFFYLWTIVASVSAVSNGLPQLLAGQIGHGFMSLASGLLFAAFGLLIRPMLRWQMKRLHRKISRKLRVG